jgi:hypothetical protein
MKQLPVIATLSHALKSVFGNLGLVILITWPWLIIGTIGMTLFSYVDVAGALTRRQSVDPATAFKFFAIVLAAFFLVAIALASIAVAWHRFILRDEVPKGWRMLRVDGVVLRYLGNLFLAVITFLLLLAPVTFIFGALGPLFGVIAFFGAVLFLSPVLYRMLIKLPGIAVENQGVTFSSAFEVTKGNYWQLFGLALILSIGNQIVTSLVNWIAGHILFPALASISSSLVPLAMIFSGAVEFLVSMVGIAVLTSLYGFFVEDREF